MTQIIFKQNMTRVDIWHAFIALLSYFKKLQYA